MGDYWGGANAFSESLLRATKYHPDYPPQGFDSLAHAQEWAQRFVTYYNTEQKHPKSGNVLLKNCFDLLVSVIKLGTYRVAA